MIKESEKFSSSAVFEGMSSISALIKAIDEDDSFYEQEALDRGISVEEVKRVHKIERENAELNKQLKQQRDKENADRTVAEWIRQSEQVKKIYPSFNLEAELKNPEFAQLIQVPGVGVRRAYEIAHLDEITEGAMRFTAKTVEKKLTDKIIANGARPSENGISSQSASVVKSDVSKLTSADIDEVKRQVARGKKITFG